MQKRQQEEEGWYRQQQLLVEAEQARRNIIAEEEQKLTDQRTRRVSHCLAMKYVSSAPLVWFDNYHMCN